MVIAKQTERTKVNEKPVPFDKGSGGGRTARGVKSLNFHFGGIFLPNHLSRFSVQRQSHQTVLLVPSEEDLIPEQNRAGKPGGQGSLPEKTVHRGDSNIRIFANARSVRSAKLVPWIGFLTKQTKPISKNKRDKRAKVSEHAYL